MFWMKKIPFIFLFFSSTLFAQELDTYKLGKAINFLTENKKILSEKWIELVKNKKVNYKKILGGEMIFKVWDTLAYRNLSFFSRDMNISRDSLLDCEGKTISVAEQKICDRYKPFGTMQFTNLIKQKNLDRDADFYVGFSRPTGIYLICEVWHRGFGNSYSVRFGEAMRILFVFNPNGDIERTYYGAVNY
jgi:hypothetical protein